MEISLCTFLCTALKNQLLNFSETLHNKEFTWKSLHICKTAQPRIVLFWYYKIWTNLPNLTKKPVKISVLWRNYIS